MNKLVATTFLCFLSLAVVSFAEAKNPLENSMQTMEKTFKQLRMGLKAPAEANKADYLALAATLKTEILKSRDMVPTKAESLPPEQKDAMVKAYQAAMDEYAKQLDVLSGYLQASQWDEANKQLDALKKLERAGHDEFRIKKEKK